MLNCVEHSATHGQVPVVFSLPEDSKPGWLKKPVDGLDNGTFRYILDQFWNVWWRGFMWDFDEYGQTAQDVRNIIYLESDLQLPSEPWRADIDPSTWARI